ncbi:hypothetical protein A2129_02210 [Candidatus Woesebacteria bacterium GWC1_42_13]|uniref:Uncharacterized protein n=2 Tax=Candidatus Woeseibacteriota TaxID=1752722 RepID=A0A1F7WV13_9BACT|nr:MAG: hypothetical protein A2112_00385 [Candidatus Woesebacteria bacterium GWA1_42_12]OGM06664.1 MAG: hypothetical protein A2129_02210 [Candidatus Woesebacteria bacterium GWC1_42_13]
MAEEKDTGEPEGIREPEVVRRRVPIRDPWKPSRIIGHSDVASGPLPTHEELPPVDPETGRQVGIQKDFMDKVGKANVTQKPPTEE